MIPPMSTFPKTAAASAESTTALPSPPCGCLQLTLIEPDALLMLTVLGVDATDHDPFSFCNWQLAPDTGVVFTIRLCDVPSVMAAQPPNRLAMQSKAAK